MVKLVWYLLHCVRIQHGAMFKVYTLHTAMRSTLGGVQVKRQTGSEGVYELVHQTHIRQPSMRLTRQDAPVYNDTTPLTTHGRTEHTGAHSISYTYADSGSPAGDSLGAFVLVCDCSGHHQQSTGGERSAGQVVKLLARCA